MITPYGGSLVNLLVNDARAAEMKATAKDFASVTLDERGLCDLELLAVGGFSPLKGFLGQADYERVVGELRLADGTLWPWPVTLPVKPGNGVAEGKTIGLRDVYGNLLAFLHVEEIFNCESDHCAAGRLEVIRVPPHYDFVELRRTPAELRAQFEELGWNKVVAFPTRGLMHRADEERTKRAAARIGGGLLIHPAVGVTKPGDVDHYTRVRCYRALVDNYYDPGSVVLSLLPLAPRPAGPREVLLHALIRRNYGCTHLLLGRDDDDESAVKYADEIGIDVLGFEEIVYLPEENRYVSIDEVPAGVKTADLSPSQTRVRRARRGPVASRVAHSSGRRRDPSRSESAAVSPGFDHLVHGPLRRGQEHRGARPGRTARRVRPQRVNTRWR